MPASTISNANITAKSTDLARLTPGDPIVSPDPDPLLPDLAVLSEASDSSGGAMSPFFTAGSFRATVKDPRTLSNPSGSKYTASNANAPVADGLTFAV